MSKLKGFVAACALVLTVSALLASVCTGSARAGGVVFFIDAQHGWESTCDGSSNPSTAQATAWHTVNGGASWGQLATRAAGNAEGDIWGGFFAFATRSTGIWVRPGRTVLRTTNAGASWHSVPGVRSAWLNDASFATSRVGWACGEAPGIPAGGVIVKTSNAGASWHVQKRITGQHVYFGLSEVSCPTATSCYVRGWGDKLGGVWATADGGKHWARRQLPRGTTAIDFPTATTGWAVGSGGTIAKTTNCGRTWHSYADSGAVNDFYSVSFCNSKVGYAVGSLGLGLRTTDAGATWLQSGPFPYFSDLNALTAVDCVDASHTWVIDNDGYVYVTSDGGNTWQANSVFPD
jgi:photosystem II stability/assembly factor-like uncharacterized protein